MTVFVKTIRIFVTEVCYFVRNFICTGLVWVRSVPLKHGIDRSDIEQIHFPPYSKNTTTPLQGVPFNPRNKHYVFWESYDKNKDIVYCVFFNVKEVSTCFFFKHDNFGDWQTDRQTGIEHWSRDMNRWKLKHSKGNGSQWYFGQEFHMGWPEFGSGPSQ